jgi:murein L,D-transpeptidase YafK
MVMRKTIIYSVTLIILGAAVYYFFPEKQLPTGIHTEKLVVYKSKRQLLLYSNGQILKTYTISLGKAPIGDKTIEGDTKTPEGLYFINDKNSTSNYHKSLGISYPDKNDIETAKQFGAPAGSDIKIHGLKNNLGFISKFHRFFDWTQGCIAVTDEEIDELYSVVTIGTPFEIYP